MACGGADLPDVRESAREAHLGDLPPLPFQLAQASTGFRRLYEGIEEALGDPMPTPIVTSEPAYRRYLEGSLRAWLDRRGSAIRAAENRARTIAGTSDDDERAVAEAIVAYLHERTAEDVLAAPVPNAATEPERAAAIRDAWRDRMAPLREAALAHWQACSRTLALASAELSAWKRRCDDEAPQHPQPSEESTSESAGRPGAPAREDGPTEPPASGESTPSPRQRK